MRPCVPRVIERQMNKKTRTVGNCLGLTLLHNCLLRKIGLKQEAVYLEQAFEIGPHVLTCLRTAHSIIDIENIMVRGFDYKNHKNVPTRILWSDKELVADIYHSQGNGCFEKGEYSEALENYKMAVHLNPLYQKAHFNIDILLDKLKMEDKETANGYPNKDQ
jgi:tetratricopeptide (TPR) repeat protein